MDAESTVSLLRITSSSGPSSPQRSKPSTSTDRKDTPRHVVCIQQAPPWRLGTPQPVGPTASIHPSGVRGQGPSTPVLHDIPLAQCANKWTICWVFPWILNTVMRGYHLQFGRCPPAFRSVVPSVAQGEQTITLREELARLLAKEAVRVVPPSEAENGFYSRYFLVPKKDFLRSYGLK